MDTDELQMLWEDKLTTKDVAPLEDFVSSSG
jgi:hypothetical protein